MVFDGKKHPRVPKGHGGGGRFTKAGGMLGAVGRALVGRGGKSPHEGHDIPALDHPQGPRGGKSEVPHFGHRPPKEAWAERISNDIGKKHGGDGPLDANEKVELHDLHAKYMGTGHMTAAEQERYHELRQRLHLHGHEDKNDGHPPAPATGGHETVDTGEGPLTHAEAAELIHLHVQHKNGATMTRLEKRRYESLSQRREQYGRLTPGWTEVKGGGGWRGDLGLITLAPDGSFRYRPPGATTSHGSAKTFGEAHQALLKISQK